MIKTSVEKLAKDIGFDIANSDDITQSNLLNGFCESLANTMGKGQLDTQLCYIANHLTAKTHRILAGLVEFLELKEKD